jgi:hypothetical protein
MRYMSRVDRRVLVELIPAGAELDSLLSPAEVVVLAIETGWLKSSEVVE